MRVGEYCGAVVAVAHRDTSVTGAAQLMRKYHVGALVVVDDTAPRPRPVGMVTDRDLVVEVLAGEANAEQLTVGDVMSADLATAQWDESLTPVLERMCAQGVRRMPGGDETGALAGVISVDDVLEPLVEALAQIPAVVRGQRYQEAERRP